MQLVNWHSSDTLKLLTALNNPNRLILLEFLDQNAYGTWSSLREYIYQNSPRKKRIAPSMISWHLKELIDIGMVKRAEHDPQVFTITNLGRKAVRAIRSLLETETEGEVGWEKPI